MNGIASLLERYKNFTPPTKAMARAVIGALYDVVGITVAERDVRISRGVAEIGFGGAQKSEILLHKEEILASARAKAGNSLLDIR